MNRRSRRDRDILEAGRFALCTGDIEQPADFNGHGKVYGEDAR